MAAMRTLAAGLLGACTTLVNAQVLTFTEDLYGPDRVPLGYAVPLPLASQSAVDGFRRYDSLSARLSALSLSSNALREVRVGSSQAGRPIYAYVVGDADGITAEGFDEAAVLVNGGIHAREWASPEVVAALIETLVAGENAAGLQRYLLDSLNLIVIPVLNVDGFLQTQRFPTQALQTEYAKDPTPARMTEYPPEYRNVPRDGRFRRKNMRDVDETLCAAVQAGCVADGMGGIDLNRNHPPFFASNNQNSADVGSLLHRGAGAGSESESQALYAAAALGPESRLRLFVDVHSFSRIYYGVETGSARRDAVARSLANTMRLAARAGSGRDYPYDPTPAGIGIGSTDEYFGYRLQIPSYTLEIEPGSNGGSEYGGFGYHHDGFVLPANQIARVREELTAANLSALYRMAGPPALIAAELRELASGTLSYAANRPVTGARRGLEQQHLRALRADTDYQLRLAFNKPMRVRDDAGNVTQLSGQTVPLAPQVALVGTDAAGQAFQETLAAPVSGWRQTAANGADGHLRYADDAYALTLRLSARAASAQQLSLRVSVQDASGQALDADPASVADWNSGWSGYEDDAGRATTDTGGSDRSLTLTGVTAPPPAPSGSGSGGGGSFGLWSLWLLSMSALILRIRGRSTFRSVS